MMNRTEHTRYVLATLITLTVLLGSACSDPAEEDLTDAGPPADGGADADTSADAGADLNISPDADAHRPTQAECDTAADKNACLAMGCGQWTEIWDITGSDASSPENCESPEVPFLSMCFAWIGDGSAIPSWHYRETDAGPQVIRVGSKTLIEGFETCKLRVAEPPEPTACGCMQYFATSEFYE